MYSGCRGTWPGPRASAGTRPYHTTITPAKPQACACPVTSHGIPEDACSLLAWCPGAPGPGPGQLLLPPVTKPPGPADSRRGPARPHRPAQGQGATTESSTTDRTKHYTRGPLWPAPLAVTWPGLHVTPTTFVTPEPAFLYQLCGG